MFEQSFEYVDNLEPLEICASNNDTVSFIGLKKIGKKRHAPESNLLISLCVLCKASMARSIDCTELPI